MCGIAGIYGPHEAGEREQMLERLVHRGPDDAGEAQLDAAWLGHRRLSIVDVDGGRQPFANAAGDVWLVGNGEVYNHEQVRGTLAPAPFATRSDNEVALHLLEERGPRGLAELNGMFAFVMAAADGRFVAARDAVGIKPLYWARRDGRVLAKTGVRPGAALARVDAPGVVASARGRLSYLDDRQPLAYEARPPVAA